MNRFDRVISIFVILQSRRVVKASFLAEKFEVSLRTIYRDIRTLIVAGIPIIGEPGVGYSIVRGYKLPPVMFDQDEALSLLAAAKIIGNMTDPELSAKHDSAMNKIKAVLRTNEKDALETLENAIIISPRKRAKKELLNPLFKAISSGCIIEINYIKAKEENGMLRILEPVGCFHRYNSWYLIAWCRMREDYRTFKVDRIESLKQLKEKVTQSHISLKEYIAKEAARVESTIVKVYFEDSIAEFTKNSRYSFGFIEEEQVEGGVVLTFLVASTEHIAYWLLSFTHRARVIDPPELIDDVKSLISSLHKHYFS